MKKIITFLLIIYAALSFPQQRAGYEFLKNEVGARALALGGAFVAVQGDINSLFYNPAGLVYMENSVGSFTYFNHLIDFKGGTILYGKPMNDKHTIGIGLNFIDYGDFEGRDEFGNDTGTFGANNIVLNVGAGYNYSKNLKFGLNTKIIYSKIAGYSSDAYVIDFGGNYYIRSQEISIGISVQNIGFVRSGYIDRKDKLPLQLRSGLTKKLAHLPLMLCFEFRQFTNNENQINLGGEFTISENFKARIGYNSFGKDQKLVSGSDQLSGISLGFGLVWKNFIIDFGYASQGSLGSQNRFTISRAW